MSTSPLETYSPLTKRAVEAATEVAKAHGISVEMPRVLANAYAVRVHLEPAPIVARVSTLTALLRPPIEEWLTREVEVASFLAEKGAPVVPPSRLLPAGPHQHDGLWITFWQYVKPLSDEIPDSALTGTMLADLHKSLRDYQGELPLLAPALNDVPRSLERIEQLEILPPEDIAFIRAKYEEALPRLQNPEGPLQPLHGDAHGGNLILSEQGLLWNDLEDVCLGPTAWDLVNIGEAGITAYAESAPESAPDAELLKFYTHARQLQGIAWVYALQPEFPNFTDFVKSLLEQMKMAE
jgi:thiamine kinase-like enzyme